MDARKNFAISTIATAPSPATSGTSLDVASGTGSRYPVAPFNAVVWPTGANPVAGNAEIIRVTSKGTGDNWTIIRAQESSSARTIIIGDQIMQSITNKTLQDIEDAVALRQLILSEGAFVDGDKTKLNGVATGATANVGDVVGPASSTNLSVPTYSGTTGKLLTTSNLVLGFGGGSITITNGAGGSIVADGRTLSTDGTKLDGIASGAQVNTVTLTNTATLTNKTLTSPVVNSPTGIVKSDVGLANVDNTSNATERAATASLTNKDLSSSSNTFPDYYPVGTIYENRTNSTNPSTYLPGQSGNTWTAITDKMIMAKGSTYTADGGEATHTHTEGSLAALANMFVSGGAGYIDYTKVTVDGGNYAETNRLKTSSSGAAYTANAETNNSDGIDVLGTTSSGSSIPPMIVAYVWERTA